MGSYCHAVFVEDHRFGRDLYSCSVISVFYFEHADHWKLAESSAHEMTALETSPRHNVRIDHHSVNPAKVGELKFTAASEGK